MKKMFAAAAVLMMFLVLISCGAEDAAPVQENVEQEQVETVVTEPAEEETEIVEEPEDVQPVPEQPEPETTQAPETEDETAEQPEIQQPAEETPAEEAVSEPVSEPAASSVDLAAVTAAMTGQMNIADAFVLDTSSLLGLYGIPAESVKQSSGFVTMSGTFPDEIVMVEAVDAAAADTVQACLQTRLDAVLVQSQTYDAENYAAAQKCSVRRNDLFVCLILSPKQDDLAAIYSTYIG